ncbi:archaea-specific SMC-related protein [Halobaculum magnesiiphilum]|uniref:AAA family ATPase n=1 Tax=Halobaculum magnesiiphilum TaxID=1017351 RepID=A0A8T8WIV5_9EURY|nr:archaea-specific SMC-related protein [Halobaculum magnesiiphilum]QZP39757.1 AAA family ATPase [Halobaculum magnesiiphilum]
MSSEQVSHQQTRVKVRNIGGIDETTVTLPPGVSVLAGRNASNRTSFLQALMGGLGSTQTTLKGDAEEGSVTLELGGETYTRTLKRSGDTVVFGGDPYLEDPEIADSFAFLLEDNEARRAVARGDDLREIIMRPIDTDQIEAEIEACEQERDELESKIQELDRLEQELPQLEAEKKETKEELETARDKLETKQAELDAVDTGVEESRSRKQDLEDAFDRVRDARSELDDLEFDLETERSTIEQLEAERDELEASLEELEEVTESTDRLEGRISELRERKRSLDDTINELGSVINFNQEMLNGEGIDLETDTDPTDALLENDETVCWTCGSEVETTQIEDTLQRLRDLRSDKLDERNRIRSEIDELSEQKESIRERKSERQQTERRLETVESDIESSRERVAELEQRIEDQEQRVSELEAEAESIELEDHDEVLELHREINGIELRIDRLESELDEINEEIADKESAIEQRDELTAEREAVTEQLTELRTRVNRIEQDAIENFNEHMETVLDILEYDNLDRIWIEQRETEVREGRKKVMRSRFDLHIVRSTADGTVYEDTIDHLSESEREVTGLVFALAGYLVHDVAEKVPFIILDSLEAIDSDRISHVVDYLSEHADFLVAALLPEDAAALSEEYTYIENID